MKTIHLSVEEIEKMIVKEMEARGAAPFNMEWTFRWDQAMVLSGMWVMFDKGSDSEVPEPVEVPCQRKSLISGKDIVPNG